MPLEMRRYTTFGHLSEYGRNVKSSTAVILAVGGKARFLGGALTPSMSLLLGWKAILEMYLWSRAHGLLGALCNALHNLRTQIEEVEQ